MRESIDWDSLDPVLKEAIGRFIADISKIRDKSARLNKAESLLLIGDKISIDQAAMLASATLEAGLKTLCQRNGVVLDTEEVEGMAGIASALRDRSIISAHDHSEVIEYVNSVRNKVMHGDFDNLNEADVREEIDFTREFFSSHGLI
jgi:hypothetical protein